MATAIKLARRLPEARITLLEKEPGVGRHQSTHNSGVLHCGLYYKPGSLKARLAVSGVAEMTQFCREHGIPHEVCGKLVVAVDEPEVARLKDLQDRGTKNGLVFGEAVVFFKTELAENFKFLRKQGMQLASKMRFVACQFDALLKDGLWLKSARHANRMARLLEQEMRKLPGVSITQPVQANGVFARLPKRVIPLLQEKHFFYVWNTEI